MVTKHSYDDLLVKTVFEIIKHDIGYAYENGVANRHPPKFRWTQ